MFNLIEMVKKFNYVVLRMLWKNFKVNMVWIIEILERDGLLYVVFNYER